MKQLHLWILKEEESGKIAIEESARQDVTALMTEVIVAVVQAEKEDSDERMEKS